MSLFLPGRCFERVLKGLVNNIEFLSLLSERCGNLHVSVKPTGVRITIRSKTSDFLQLLTSTKFCCFPCNLCEIRLLERTRSN